MEQPVTRLLSSWAAAATSATFNLMLACGTGTSSGPGRRPERLEEAPAAASKTRANNHRLKTGLVHHYCVLRRADTERRRAVEGVERSLVDKGLVRSEVHLRELERERRWLDPPPSRYTARGNSVLRTLSDQYRWEISPSASTSMLFTARPAFGRSTRSWLVHWLTDAHTDPTPQRFVLLDARAVLTIEARDSLGQG